jgi:hypothetical protein
VLRPKKQYAVVMLLRILLRCVIALGLLLQGGFGAGAAFAGAPDAHHHCHASMAHSGDAPKCPCCPTKSTIVDCASMCAVVAMLPPTNMTFALILPSPAPAGENDRVVLAVIDTPLRPPIS